jgi:replicative DNA helicase
MTRREKERQPPKDPTGRVPPHDLFAEGGLLSHLLNRSDQIFEVADILRADHFYSGPNSMVYEAMIAVATKGDAIDIVSVGHHLHAENNLERAGGPAYLNDLLIGQPAIVSARQTATIIVDKARQRKMIAACQLIAAEGYDTIVNVGEWLDQAEGVVHSIATDRAEDSIETAHSVLARVYADIENGDAQNGIPSGLPDLDRLIGGFKGGQMIVIGALPGCGKTALAEQMGRFTANRTEKAEVLLFSMEMSREEIVLRGHFSAARVDASKLNNRHKITAAEWAELTRVAPTVGLRNVRIDDRRGITPLQIRSRARRVQAEAQRKGRHLALVVIDYLQLIKLAGNRPDNREQEVAEISRSLKALAGELNVPIIALAQLNADSTNRPDKRPRSSDLRESKAVWADADKVILIHAPAALERSRNAEKQGNEDEPFPPETVDLIVDKNRGGRVGTRTVLFWPSYVCFTSYTEQEAGFAVDARAKPDDGQRGGRTGGSRYGAGQRGRSDN